MHWRALPSLQDAHFNTALLFPRSLEFRETGLIRLPFSIEVPKFPIDMTLAPEVAMLDRLSNFSRIIIKDNPNLQIIDLAGVVTVTELEIANNAPSTIIDCMNLSTAGDMTISKTGLVKLSKLSSVAGTLQFVGNKMLSESLRELRSLKLIRNLIISGNSFSPSLYDSTEYFWLPALLNIEKDFIVTDNVNLTKIILPSLMGMGGSGGNFTVERNEELRTISFPVISKLLSRTTVTGGIDRYVSFSRAGKLANFLKEYPSRCIVK